MKDLAKNTRMASNRTLIIKTLVIPIALLAGLGRIIIDFVAKFSNSGPLLYYSTFFISFILEVFLIIYLIKKFKKMNENKLNLKEGVKIAVATMAIVGSLFALYSFLYNTYVDPNFQTNTAIAWGELFGQGDKVRAEIAKNSANNSPLGIFFVVLQFSFLGSIIGIIVSSILGKKNKISG